MKLKDYTKIVDLNNKPTNPKDVLGAAKIPYHLWPNTATLLGVMGMLEGAVKYGRSNYRALGVRASVYYDATRRHLDAWFEGENNTNDHQLPHLGNALACLAIIVDAEAKGILIDDRMYPGGYLNLRDKLTPEVSRIKEMYKGKKPHHYSKLDVQKLEQLFEIVNVQKPWKQGNTLSKMRGTKKSRNKSKAKRK